MKSYKDSITLVKNSRGVWDIDSVKGCYSGMINTNGCYGECYAAKNAKIYGIDFSKTVIRYFESWSHEQSIIDQINLIDMPFVRIGVSGDPSEYWDHTLNVCEVISRCNNVLYDMYKKSIVIITKHWNNLTESQLCRIERMDVCINTSVSALDSKRLLENRLIQYNRLKQYCKSVLRIVSCNFNIKNKVARKLSYIQDGLFDNKNTLDTIFRVSSKNKLVMNGVLNIEKVRFLNGTCLVSRFNKSAYFGRCENCPEMCGLNYM